MGRRRLLLGTVLFVMAGIILVLMNRYSSFLLAPRKPVAIAASAGAPYVYEIFDPEDGTHSGRLTAARYEALPDGSVDCRDVSVNLLGTPYGDVTLTCGKAVVKVDEISKAISGKVTLEGNVNATAVKDDKVVASGRFEKVTFDAKTRDLVADGRVDLTYGDGFSISGDNLSGNTDKMHFVIERAVRVILRPPTASEGAQSDASTAFGSLPEEIDVEADGPLTYDGASSEISFAGNVTASGGDMRLSGGGLLLKFEPGKAPSTAAPGQTPMGWKPVSLDVTGPAEIRKADVIVTGSRITWQASPSRAVVDGAPARLAMGDDFIEAPQVVTDLSEKGAPLKVEAKGRGRASVTSSGGKLPGMLAGSAAKGHPAPDSTGTAPATTSDAKALATWTDSLRYDVASGMLVLTGDVAVDYDKSRVTASRMSVSVAGEPESGIVAFNADGGVTIVNGDRTITASSVVYNVASDAVTLAGSPVTVVTPKGTFTGGLVSYSPGRRTISAEGGCNISIPPGDNAVPGGTESPVFVASPRMKGDLSRGDAEFACEGGVAAIFGDNRLGCSTLKLSGVPIDLDGTAADSAKPNARVEGSGDVVFVQGPLSARGDTVVYTQSDGNVHLLAKKGSRVEVAYGDASNGDAATIWGDDVRTDAAAREIRCSKPQVAISSRGMLLGFSGGRSPGGTRTKSGDASSGALTKLYITSGGDMVIKQTADDKGTLTFDGGVEGIAHNSDSSTDDRVTAGTLVFDMDLEKPVSFTAASAAPAPTPKAPRAADARKQKADLTGAHASGGVTLKYTGPDRALEGRGDSFAWTKATDTGRLSGKPAAVWTQGQTATANEFMYNFTEEKVIVNGGGSGSFTVPRRAKAKK